VEADFTGQCDATFVKTVGSRHYPFVLAEFQGQLKRYRAAALVVGFRALNRYFVHNAAGATLAT
jgi:hypothetical protein